MASEHIHLHRKLDQLVDGELPDDELRTLLSDCENEPSNWRSMAIAFVESQVVAKELRALRDENEPRTVKPAWRLPVRLSEWAALAVAAILAIGIGFGFGMLSIPEAKPSDNGFDNRVVEFGPRLPESVADDDSFQILVSNPDGSLREVEVPLLNDIQEFRNRSASPSDLVDQIRRQGHQVEHQRRFVPVTLKDGRDAIVPIDNMRFKSKRYQ